MANDEAPTPSEKEADSGISGELDDSPDPSVLSDSGAPTDPEPPLDVQEEAGGESRSSEQPSTHEIAVSDTDADNGDGAVTIPHDASTLDSSTTEFTDDGLHALAWDFYDAWETTRLLVQEMLDATVPVPALDNGIEADTDRAYRLVTYDLDGGTLLTVGIERPSGRLVGYLLTIDPDTVISLQSMPVLLFSLKEFDLADQVIDVVLAGAASLEAEGSDHLVHVSKEGVDIVNDPWYLIAVSSKETPVDQPAFVQAAIEAQLEATQS